MPDSDTIIKIIISIFFGIISTFLGVDAYRSRRKSKKLLRGSTNFDWEQMLVAAGVISKKLDKATFSPDLILAVQGGGGIFAQLLSMELGEEIPLTTIHILPKDFPQKDPDNFLVKTTEKWVQLIPRHLEQYSQQKVLIVDDFCIGGGTLASLRTGLEELGFAPNNIFTVAAICTQLAIELRKPADYFWIDVEHHRVNFPWGPGDKLKRMGL